MRIKVRKKGKKEGWKGEGRDGGRRGKGMKREKEGRKWMVLLFRYDKHSLMSMWLKVRDADIVAPYDSWSHMIHGSRSPK